MSLWMERHNELVHYYDLQREAELERLARQALKGQPRKQMVHCKVLSWLGSRLATWGVKLQERYGAAAAASSLAGRHLG